MAYYAFRRAQRKQKKKRRREGTTEGRRAKRRRWESNQLARVQIIKADIKDNPCLDCGEIRENMTFDHVRDKKYTIGSITRIGPFLREVGKCDLVCRDCHDKREYKRGTMGF